MSLPPDEIASLRSAREKKLLARWGDGARLSADERAEIAHLIPAPPSRVAPKADPTPSARPEVVAPALVLESPPAEAPAGRAGCRHPIVPGSPYEAMYATTIRTIKRWRHIGSQAQPPAMPPLDEPYRMAAWYRANMERIVPARLLQLEEDGAPKPTAPSAPPAESAAVTPPPVAPAVAPSPQRAPSTSLATGYAATLDRFRQAEAVAAQRYFDAVSSADENERAHAPRYQKEWNDVADKLRSYEKDASRILAEADNLWDASAVVDAITGIHTQLAAGIRRLHRRMRQQHPDAHALPPSEQEALWDAEVDALFSALTGSRFTSATIPPAAPATDPIPHGVAA